MDLKNAEISSLLKTKPLVCVIPFHSLNVNLNSSETVAAHLATVAASGIL